MTNTVAVSEILSHMESMKKRIQAQDEEHRSTIERMRRDRQLATDAIDHAQIAIGDNIDAVAWLNREMARLRATPDFCP